MKREFESPAMRRSSRRLSSINAPTSVNSGHQRSFDEFSCISSGTTHQADARRFRGNNAQCVAMSACACIHSCISDRNVFSTADIDMILRFGDLLYLRLRPLGIRHTFAHLFPEDLQLSDGIQVGNHLALTSVRWINNGLYPNSSNIDPELNNLEEMLRNDVFNADHSDATDSYLFTGLANTTSFWRHNDEYYYFNSHGVDQFNEWDVDRRGEYLARLFRCSSIKALARVLFKKLPSNWVTDVHAVPQYTINRLTVVSSRVNIPSREPVVRLERLSASKLNEVIDYDHTLDPKFTTLKPVVVLERLPIAELSAKDIAKYSSDLKLSHLKPTVVLAPLTDIPTTDAEIVAGKSRGRPRKQKRGPSATVTRANFKAYQKYAKKHPKVIRESAKKYYQKNRQEKIAAATRYSNENPEIHRDAVNRYSQQNSEMHREKAARYEKNSRNVDPNLRDASKLIGQRSDDELLSIDTFYLKKTCLFNADTYKCSHCKAPLFEEEKSREKWCCGGGGINKIKQYAPLTEEFYSDPSFIKRSRAYNNLFAFSALGTTHGFQNPDSGISFVKVQGRIYHRVFDLSYTGSTNPIGLYIDDSSERERIATGQSLNTDIVRAISHYLHERNPYIDCFKRLSREVSEEAHLVFDSRSSRPRDGNILGDRPLGNEVAAIISTETERFIPRCIAIWKIGGSKPHTVDIMDKLYESFQYPLLYPNGETGWSPGVKNNSNNKLAQVKYVRCLLLSEPRFSQLGRLSEEWLVDMQCRILEERLRFFHRMQTAQRAGGDLRTAQLQELLNDETVQGEGGVVPGRIYLPCTFVGCERYMKNKYMDAIAVLNRLGGPSFFLTMTCNPKWPEIQQSTPAGQNPSPIICARVFQLKLGQLLRDLQSGNGAYFGKIVYILHVIEFQKRGLPHAHIAFRVAGGGPVQNVDIDSFIRADIPSPTEAEGKLRAAVLKHMIHGPCGPNYRTDLQCWDSEINKCTRYFPKKETDVTYCDDRGFTHLRRDSKNEATIKYRNRDVVVNDLWVAPYNAALLLRYDCHINLEATSARAMIKYLFKYITKGVDAARVALIPEELKSNEIETYVTKRYIGTCDAAWRVFEFNIVGREPTVIQLPVHLENQHSVFFHPDNAAQAAERSGSLLLTYFSRPPGEEFDRMTYVDFYEKFIVHASRPNLKTKEIIQLSNGRFITSRTPGSCVARMFWVGPNRGEQFYLRVLLSAYPCRNYDDLIRLGGVDCTTFQDAARAVGMADDESEYRSAMQEASTFMTASRLRRFFVMLAVNGIPVASLWDTFKDQLSEDFIKRLGLDSLDRAHENSLVLINRLLRKHGSNLRDQGLPVVHDDTTELGREHTEYDRELLNQFVEEWLPKLSVDQRVVYDYVHEIVTNSTFRVNNNNAIFVDGPAGTGKTLLLNLITSHVRGDIGGVVLCTASSGIAAQNYPNGMTAHSMFKFPIDLVDDLGYWSVTNRSQRGDLIRNADVIIYDEAPMAHKYLIHMLDRSLRDLMGSEKIFGGKLIIFAGDFRQIPPVVTNARTNQDIINCSVKSSPLWDKLKTFSLTTSQRQTDDPEFGQFLLKLGSNELPSEKVKVGRHFQNLIDLSEISYVTDLNDLIDFVFPFAVLEEPDICAGRAILSTHNAGVREINNEMIRRLPNEVMHFFAVDNVVSEGSDPLFFGTDALNRLQPNGVPEYDLVLKVGCVCMVTRNLSFADGLLNGTKVIVVAATHRLITVRKPNKTEDYLIPRIQFKAPIDRRSPIEMMRKQFPLQVCYAMSIHKSQGQTINRVGVDLRSDVFSHGQLYVALGRVQSRDDIRILTHRARVSNDRSMANNVVFPQLL